jgi:aspartyl/glutamyl-tRNA(Asn/Gln) amidotransferase C subunit
MTNAPDVVDAEQVDALHIRLGEDVAPAEAAKAKKALSGADVENVANLARLRLTGEEGAAMAAQLGDIIAFADQLNSIDTRDVPITAHIVPVKNVFRMDETIPSPGREELLSNAPSKEEGFFYVPRVVE